MCFLLFLIHPLRLAWKSLRPSRKFCHEQRHLDLQCFQQCPPTRHAQEWEVRVKLAAAYRLAALYKWTDHIYTHFSARVPGPEEHFLINAFGLLFDEINASNLVKVDLDGTIVDDPTGLGINYAGYVIHSAIHGGSP